MRKRYLIIIIILVLVVSTFSIMFYLSLPTTFPNVFNEPQGNESEGDKGFLGLPFRLPWQTTTQTPSNKSSGGGGGGGGQQGGGGGGTGGSIGDNTTNPTPPTQEVYTLSINSIPASLRIYAGYYINNVVSSSASDTPYNLEVYPNSLACVIPAFVINGSLRWAVDGIDCEFSVCEEFYHNETEILYTDHGCLIDMNTDRSVTLYYNPA